MFWFAAVVFQVIDVEALVIGALARIWERADYEPVSYESLLVEFIRTQDDGGLFGLGASGWASGTLAADK
jgi:hypothetical protein